jgi:hypothetical protein
MTCERVKTVSFGFWILFLYSFCQQRALAHSARLHHALPQHQLKLTTRTREQRILQRKPSRLKKTIVFPFGVSCCCWSCKNNPGSQPNLAVV